MVFNLRENFIFFRRKGKLLNLGNIIGFVGCGKIKIKCFYILKWWVEEEIFGYCFLLNIVVV